MSPSKYTRIVLHERPPADITPTTFREEVLQVEDLAPNGSQALVKVDWLSLDPAMRGYLRDVRSYMPPVQLGAVMRAQGLGTVVEVGKDSPLKAGDLVSGPFGWTEYALMANKDLEVIKPSKGVDALDYLNSLGLPGLTAYFGLRDVGQLKSGETLVVSGAAGAVGVMACQMGIRTGAKVYAIAGTPEKCEYLEKEIGVFKAFNYKSPTFKKDFKATVPMIDVIFENVGGEILDMCMSRLNKGARIALCGAISAYNSTSPKGLNNYLALISQRAKIEGFIIFDYLKDFPTAYAEISSWIADGSLKRNFHIVEGLESAPAALPMLFSGANKGKLVVKVSDVKKLNSKL